MSLRAPLSAERKALELALAERGSRLRPNRLVFAAAHVVFEDSYADSTHSLDDPGSPEELLEAIDWRRTAAFRRHLDSLGFGVAEAMDTAQRFELGWSGARRLIEATGALGLEHGFVAGASYDQLGTVRDVGELVDAVLHQIELIQRAGGVAVILPMPWLARSARSGIDAEALFVETYRRIVEAAAGPLFLHWLGPAFHPDMADYFPGDSLHRILALDRVKVRGVKLSILDPRREVELRRELLPHDQIVLTGDDWAFRGLIEGGEADRLDDDAEPVERWTRIGGWDVALGDFSHALLGIFDAVAAPMSVALGWLRLGELRDWRRLADPCEALGRVVFEAPTSHYKVGLALLAERCGHQPNALLANHMERARPLDHLQRVLDAAIEARVLDDHR